MKDKSPLTPKQKMVLHFIQDVFKKEGVIPSYREIQGHFNFKSLGSVHKYICALEKKGWLKKEEGCARSLQIEEELQNVVSCESSVASLVGKLEFNKQIQTLKDPEILSWTTFLGVQEGESDLYALKIEGNDFLPLHILHGDILVIDSQGIFQEGALVLYSIVAEGMRIGYCFLRGDFLVFKQYPEADEEHMFEESQVMIYGLIISVLRSYNPIH